MTYVLPKPEIDPRNPTEFVGVIDVDGKPIPRQLNAFSIFASTHREQLRQRMPHLSGSQQTTKLAELWSQMSPDHQEMYYEEARLATRQHQQRYQDFSYRSDLLQTYRDIVEHDARRQEAIQRTQEPENEPEYKFGGYVPPFNVFSSRKKRQKKEQANTVKAFQISESRDSPTNQLQSLKPGNVWVNGQEQPTAGSNFNVQCRVQNQLIANHQLIRKQSKETNLNEKPYLQTPYHQVRMTVPQYQCRPVISTKVDKRNRTHPDHINLGKKMMEDECQRAVESISMDVFKNELVETEGEREFLHQNGDLIQTRTHTVDEGAWGPHAGGDNKAEDSTDTQANDKNYDTGKDNEIKHMYESSKDVGQTSDDNDDHETNYVMIPCDVNIAKMLGWPIHLLPRVTKSVLNSFKDGVTTGSNTPPFPISEKLPNVIKQMSPMSKMDSTILSHPDYEVHYQADTADGDRRHHTSIKSTQDHVPSLSKKHSYDELCALDLSFKRGKFINDDLK